MINKLLNRLAESWPDESWAHCKVIVAVSGGPDSVALLRLLHLQAKKHSACANLVVVHCNHKTQVQNEKDEEFVRQLAQQLGLEFILQRRLPEADEARLSNSEEVLRDFRYQALLKSAQSIGARYIATGHNFEDQVETILFRTFRGTGIQGLGGIRPIRVIEDVSVVRPMLKFRRSEILELLAELKQPFCEDLSNESNLYTRNFLRNEVIPLIESKFGEPFRDSIFRMGQQASDYVEALDAIAPELAMKKTEYGHEFNSVSLNTLPSLVITHSLKRAWHRLGLAEKEMTQEKWNCLTDFITGSDNGTLQLPGQVTVLKSNSIIQLRSTPKFKRSGK